MQIPRVPRIPRIPGRIPRIPGGRSRVSCTRNATFCIEDTEITILCVQKIEGLFLGEIKAPAGTLGGAPSMCLCLGDIKYALFMPPRHK